MFMYSNQDLIDIIKAHVPGLTWFENKEQEFRRNKEYIEEKDAICVVEKEAYPIYDEDEEISGYEEANKNHEFNFQEYCSCYLPICDATAWGSYAADFYSSKGRHVGKSNNIDELAYELVKEISDFLKEEKDAITTHKFIHYVLKKIEVEVTVQKESLVASDIYCSVLDDFLNRCTSMLYRKYERLLTIYKYTVDYKDELIFDLKQDELAALLNILFTAKFIYTPTKKYTTSFLDFCESYFHFRNQKEDMSYTPAKEIGKKFSEARGPGHSTKARKSIINRLQQAFKEL